MDDVNQIYPVAIKSIADDSNRNISCGADGISKIAFSKFIISLNQLETFNFTFNITNVVRQRMKILKRFYL